jgi:hypothetical protein
MGSSTSSASFCRPRYCSSGPGWPGSQPRHRGPVAGPGAGLAVDKGLACRENEASHRWLLILRNADLRGRLPPGEYRAGRSAPLVAPRRFSWTPKADVFEPKTTTPPNRAARPATITIGSNVTTRRRHQNSAEAHRRLRRQGRLPAPFQRLRKFLDLHFEFGDLLAWFVIHAG